MGIVSATHQIRGIQGEFIIHHLRLGKWKVISVLFIIFAGISGVLAAEITVPADNATIQDAVDYAQPGDTIVVSSGVYEEYVVVDTTLTLRGTGNTVIAGDGTSKQDVVALNADGILFEGFTVNNSRSSYSGIVVSADNIRVLNCTSQDNGGIGIESDAVSGLRISGCTVTRNGDMGIYLDGASGALIGDTVVTGSEADNIYLDTCTGCSIQNCTSTSSEYGRGITVYYADTTVISGTTVRDIPYEWGMYVYSAPGCTIQGNTIENCSTADDAFSFYGGAVILDSEDTTFQNNILTENAVFGLEYSWSDRGIITGNTITGTQDIYSSRDAGCYIDTSHDTIVSDNTISGGEYRGLYLEDCESATLTNNTLSGNRYNFGLTGDRARYFDAHTIDASNTADGRPIIYRRGTVAEEIDGSVNAATVYCIDCTDGAVKDLRFTNTTSGVLFWNTSNTTLSNITISSCEDGIVLLSSGTNTITGNQVAAASEYGITLDSASSENTIYLNTFQGADGDVSSAATDTLWNSPAELLYYYLGSPYTSHLGNQWASYSGNDSTGDGVGDTPYLIDTDTDDPYPLAAPHTAYTFAANQPPNAAFEWDPASPDTNDLMQFTDLSVDTDGTIETRLWDFGDGSTSPETNPQHQYLSAGWYTASLNVTDNGGASDEANAPFFIHDAGSMTIWVPDNATTIQGAVNIARDGDTVTVRAGDYPENVVVNRSILLQGVGYPVLNAMANTGFTVPDDGCTIDGFVITNATGFEAAGILVTGNTPAILNTVIQDGFRGIAAEGVDGGILQNNTCQNNENIGILLDSSTGMVIRNNTCRDNAPYHGEGMAYGTELIDSSGNILYWNTFDNMVTSTPGLFHNAYDANTTTPQNLWYNTTLRNGNWYSDYYGEDSNADGVGDTPYEIAGGVNPNRDLYPMMNTGPQPGYPPIISAITVQEITTTSAVIEWDIENLVVSDNRVRYGTDPTLAGASWSAWTNETVSPSVPLTGLSADTTWYYQCHSSSVLNASAEATSATDSFDTLERVPGIITVDDDNADIPVPPADYATITDALAASMDGDTIFVYAGNYTGYHEVTTRVNLTGIGWPVVFGREDDPTDEIGDIFAFRADGCVLDGFDIREAGWNNATISSPQDSAGIRIGYAVGSISSWGFGDADNTVIRNNRIEEGWYGIIATPGSNDNIIDNNTINATRRGAWFWYAQNNAFTNNTVTNTAYNPLKNTYRTTSVDSYSTNNQFRDNLFDTADWTPFGPDDSYGREILIEDTRGNIFTNNTLLNRTYIRIAGDGNTVSENTISGPSEYHFAGIDISEDGNTVRNNTVRNHKYGVLLKGGADNLLMAGNTIEDCSYGFGYAGDLNYASSRPLRNLIDTTNTVDGLPIYWIVGETGRTYNYSTLIPAPAYLALIGCSNITAEDFYLENNAQSLLIYRSDNITLNSVSAHGNGYQGILIGDSADIMITDSHADSNGKDAVSNSGYAGIYATETGRLQIIRSTATANNPTGIFLQYSCPDLLIEDCTVTNNGHSTEADESYGIRNSGSDNLRMTVTGCTIGNDFATRQGIGIANHGSDALIYNNRFLNNSVIHAQNWGTDTRWNVTPIPGTNVLGGPWTAGNFWDDYTGTDTAGDGVGDTDVPYTTGGGTPGEDYHPLVNTFTPDSDPPVIIIHAPVDGETYPAASVPLTVSSPDTDVAAWWYALDDGVNVTFVPDITLPPLTAGSHTLLVGARDFSSNANSSVVTFVAENDTTPPQISVISPVNNTTYTTHDIPLQVASSDDDLFSWWYTLDGGENITFTPNSTLFSLANGTHLLHVSADDITGNVNTTAITFTVQATGPLPPPTPTPVPEDGDNDAPPADAYPFPVVEEPAFAITILTPKPVRMTERFTEVTYTSPRPLSRAYYRFDDGGMVQVAAGADIPIGRMALGTHTVTITGVDYYGRYGEGTVAFTIIPLALGERESVGTGEFPDDAAFGFTGERTNYTLTFEAETAPEESVDVFVNRRLTGIPGVGTDVTPSAPRNGALTTIAGPGTGWQTYEVTVPEELLMPDEENLISFIHRTNPSRTEGLADWSVRDVTLAPSLRASAPSIEVFTPDQACGPDEEMMAWVKIAGIAPGDRYSATVYLVAPDGTEISFPEGTDVVAPLDAQYVTNNHHGRLPGAIIFDEEKKPGTYRLAAILTPEGSSQLISLSSVPIYYSTAPSVKLYQNRADLTDGMPLRITGAVTRGEESMNASLSVILEPPEGPALYLPGKTERYAAIRTEPLTSQYLVLLDEPVTDAWQDGTYAIRARLTSGEGVLLSEDMITFSVSREDGMLQVIFPYEVRAKTLTESRIRLTDTSTREIVQELRTDGSDSKITLTVPAGTYLISGECTTADGGFWIIPGSSDNRVEIQAGGTTTKEIGLLPPVGGMYAEVIP